MTAGWASDWVSKKLSTNPEVQSVQALTHGGLRVTRGARGPFDLAALEREDVVGRADIDAILHAGFSPQFVVNVPVKAIWTGDAIEIVHAIPAGFGGMADLSRAMQLNDVSSYRFKTYQFFENGLRQHSAVRDVHREFDRVLRVSRKGLADLTIVLIDAYEMSAEDIRNARAKYGVFDVALKMTSYGGITTAAHSAAKSMSAEAFLWSGLLGRLNR